MENVYKKITVSEKEEEIMRRMEEMRKWNNSGVE